MVNIAISLEEILKLEFQVMYVNVLSWNNVKINWNRNTCGGQLKKTKSWQNAKNKSNLVLFVGQHKYVNVNIYNLFDVMPLYLPMFCKLENIPCVWIWFVT